MARTARRNAAPHRERFIHAAWQLSKTLNKTLDEALEPVGITIGWYGALDLLRSGQLSAADLARALGLTPQTVNTTVKALVDNGLVERRPHPVHGRIKVLAVTPVGLLAHEQASVAIDGVESRLREALGDADFVRDRDDLWRLVTALGGPTGSVAPLWPFAPDPA